MKLESLINKKKAKKDSIGIWKTNATFSEEVTISKNAWEKIYNFDLKKLEKDRKDFFKNKLQDHLKYINDTYSFSKQTIYLEIGCGPAYIGEFLMKNKDCYFIGVDFNYPMLVTLKKFLEKKGYKKFLLIHADINEMPLLNKTVDFIYGGGVIEHTPDTNHIVKELFRILKKGGVSFNTVPAFNIQWITRCYNNIPSVRPLKKVFEYIHINIFKKTILEKYYGYELSFTIQNLKKIHLNSHFDKITSGAFAFHPSSNKLKNHTLREIYFRLSTIKYLCPMYYLAARK